MARIATGVSKKANRENLAAFNLVLEWRNYGAKGFFLTPELAWTVSGGKFGTAPVMINAMPLAFAPEGAATVDAMEVARYVLKQQQAETAAIMEAKRELVEANGGWANVSNAVIVTA